MSCILQQNLVAFRAVPRAKVFVHEEHPAVVAAVVAAFLDASPS